MVLVEGRNAGGSTSRRPPPISTRPVTTESASSCLQVFLETGVMTFLPTGTPRRASYTGRHSSASTWAPGPPAANFNTAERTRASSHRGRGVEEGNGRPGHGRLGDLQGGARIHNRWIQTGATPEPRSPVEQPDFRWEVRRDTTQVRLGQEVGAERQHPDGEHIYGRRWRQYQQYRGLWVETGVTPPQMARRQFPTAQRQRLLTPPPEFHAQVSEVC